MGEVILFILLAVSIFQIYRNIRLKFRGENKKEIITIQVTSYLSILIYFVTGSTLLLILEIALLLLVAIKPKKLFEKLNKILN